MKMRTTNATTHPTKGKTNTIVLFVVALVVIVPVVFVVYFVAHRCHLAHSSTTYTRKAVGPTKLILLKKSSIS